MRALYFYALWSGEGNDGWTNTCPSLSPLLASALLRSLDSLICRPLGYLSLLFQWQVPPWRSPAGNLFPKQRNSLSWCFPPPSSVMHIKKKGFIFRFHKAQVSLQVIINCKKIKILLLCSVCVNDNISFPHHPFWFSYLIPHIGPWPNKQQYLCMSLTICVWR